MNGEEEINPSSGEKTKHTTESVAKVVENGKREGKCEGSLVSNVLP